MREDKVFAAAGEHVRPATCSGYEESADLRAVLDDMRRVLAPIARRRGVRLRIAVPRAPIHVRTGACALRGFVGDVARHAIDCAPPGGRVEAWARTTASQAMLFVHGDGAGLPAHARHALATQLGGRVGVQPRFPRGAVTWLLLPRAVAPPGGPGT